MHSLRDLIIDALEARHEILVVHGCFQVVSDHRDCVSNPHVLLNLLPCSGGITAGRRLVLAGMTEVQVSVILMCDKKEGGTISEMVTMS